jgi:indole-3-glycerol phosphate synthase
VITTLNSILEATRQRVEADKRATDEARLRAAAEAHKPRGFRQRLAEMGKRRPAVIAELKKASPSRGLIRADFDSVALAQELEKAGAACLSVLTDEQHFQGSLENLRRASAATAIPCIRKDFIVDAFQVLEARAHGADAILLIVAALTDDELRRLHAVARLQELDVLCEVHDAAELDRALALGFDLIGVNNRNLKTFQVDITTAERLAPKFPDTVVRVAESGLHSSADLARLRAAGYQGFLIGESLMAAEHPGAKLRELLVAWEH